MPFYGTSAINEKKSLLYPAYVLTSFMDIFIGGKLVFGRTDNILGN